MRSCKVSTLEGNALEWALVQMSKGFNSAGNEQSTEWQHLLESERISIQPCCINGWYATVEIDEIFMWGKSPCEAVTRCYIAKKQGFIIDIPSELCSDEQIAINQAMNDKVQAECSH